MNGEPCSIGEDRSLKMDGTLIDVKDVALILNCSTRHVRRLADSGRMPRPVKLGALVRWSHKEITEWVSDGCRAVRSRKMTRP